jgi:ATP/maltotriose-dependent transcriptional regulator MalT
MLRSLFRQLVCSPLPDKVQKLWDDHQQGHTEPSHSELLDAIGDTITAHAHVFLVLDALDEYPEDKPFGRSTLLELISQLLRTHPRCLHLVVTSRREPDIRKTLQRVASFSINVDRALNEDVRKFINHALNHELIRRWGSKLMSLATEKLLESEER